MDNLEQLAFSQPEPVKEKPRVWSFWPTIGFSVAILASFMAAQGIVSVVFLAARLSAGISFDDILNNLASDGLLLSLATFASSILCVGLILLFIKLKPANIKEYLGLRRFSWKTFLVLMGVFILLLVAIDYLTPPSSNASDSTFTIDAYKTAVWPVLLWLAVAGFGPVFEEVFFRGFLFAGLEQSRLGSAGAIFITALLWASLHLQYSLFGMASIMVMGLVFGFVRLKTGSLWSTILMHTVWNALALLLVVLSLRSGG
jgi:membrane protease YdiL (CAAX protease family)